MRGIFFYTAGIAFTSGIFIRSFFDIGMSGVLLLGIIGTACFFAGKLKANSYQFDSPLFLIALACVALSLGVWRMHAEDNSPSLFVAYEGEKVSLTGRVLREPEIRETTVHLYVLPTAVPPHTNELVLVTTDRFGSAASNLSYGDTVRAEGILTLPEPFGTDGGRTFNYPEYLKARGVTYTISFADVEIEREEEGTFFGYLFRGKKKFMDTIERAIPEPHAGLGEGVLLGVKRALGESLEKVFRETGIIHIVVLSGYNIMIVVECIMYVLTFFFFPRTRMVVGISMIALFALLVGLSATVVRASVMAGLLLIARASGRTYAVLRALVLAGVVMLISNPYLLVHDPGFQLSFLATLGLILLSPHIEKHLSIIPETIGMRGVVTATVATQIFVLPLILYHMGLFSIVSIMVNALVLPMVPIAMLLTFVTGVVGIFSQVLAQVVGYFAYLSLGYIIAIAEFFGKLPFASVTIGTFPFCIVILSYACFTFVLIRLYKNNASRALEDLHSGETAERDTYDSWTIVEEKDVKDFPFR